MTQHKDSQPAPADDADWDKVDIACRFAQREGSPIFKDARDAFHRLRAAYNADVTPVRAAEDKPSYDDLLRACHTYQERCGQSLEDTLAGKWTNPQAVPDGFVLVPREPTGAMINFARKHHEGDFYLPVALYKAMIEAAEKEQK